MVAKSLSAYNYIKERILVGDFPPKADISEKRLQEELGISRTPIHEALSAWRMRDLLKPTPERAPLSRM